MRATTTQHSIHDIFAGLILCFLGLWAFIAYENWHFDDALIVDRIAHNLIYHKQWAYNLGETLNASTSVLNTVLIALSSAVLSIPVLSSSHLITTISIVLAGWMLYRDTFNQLNSYLALAASCLVSISLALNSTWGLEPNLFIALSLLALSVPAGSFLSGVSFGAVILARPDGVLLFGLHFLYTWYRNRRFPYLSLIGASIILAPWFIYSFITFGSLFPDTLSNKMWQGRSGYWGPGRVYVKALVDHVKSFSAFWLIGVPFFFIGLLSLIRFRSLFLLIIIFAAIQQASYIVLNVPGYHWYFTLLDFTLAVCTILGLFSLFPANLFKPFNWVVPILALGIGGYFFFGYSRGVIKDGRDVAYREVVSLIKEKSTKSDSVALIEVGTIGYELIETKIIDLLGLTSKNPQFITNEHLDNFFALSPSVIVLHEPVWHFESSIFEDLRFRLNYKKGETRGKPPFTMSVYTKREGEIPSVEKYIRDNYVGLEPSTEKTILPSSSSEKALCIIDLINGTLASGTEIRAPLGPLTFKGWAVVKEAPRLSDDVLIILHSTDRGEYYSVSAKRHDRPDVAIHLGEPKFTAAGFNIDAHTLSSSKGAYRVSLVQSSKENGTRERCDLPFTLILG